MMQRLIPNPLRGELVRAAENVLDKQGSLPRNPENAALSRLVQVTGEAACAEEVANYLRYQGARGRWKRSLAEDVIGAVNPLLGSLGSEPERLAAWRLYATYLRRAYGYRREVARDQERARRREAPLRPESQSGAGAAPARGEAAARARGERRRPRRRGRRPGTGGEGSAAPDAAEQAANGSELDEAVLPESLAEPAPEHEAAAQEHEPWQAAAEAHGHAEESPAAAPEPAAPPDAGDEDR